MSAFGFKILISVACGVALGAAWSVGNGDDSVAIVQAVLLYVLPVAAGARAGWPAAAVIPMAFLATASFANYGPAPDAWDGESAIVLVGVAAVLAGVGAWGTTVRDARRRRRTVG